MLRLLVAIIAVSTVIAAQAGKVVIANAKDFNKQVSAMNACYLSSQTQCNGVDMSQYYWSSDPKAYWKSVNQNLDNSNPWASAKTNAPSITPTKTVIPQETVPVTTSVAPLSPQESTGIILSANNNDTAPNDNHFIIG